MSRNGTAMQERTRNSTDIEVSSGSFYIDVDALGADDDGEEHPGGSTQVHRQILTTLSKTAFREKYPRGAFAKADRAANRKLLLTSKVKQRRTAAQATRAEQEDEIKDLAVEKRYKVPKSVPIWLWADDHTARRALATDIRTKEIWWGRARRRMGFAAAGAVLVGGGLMGIQTSEGGGLPTGGLPGVGGGSTGETQKTPYAGDRILCSPILKTVTVTEGDLALGTFAPLAAMERTDGTPEAGDFNYYESLVPDTALATAFQTEVLQTSGVFGTPVLNTQFNMPTDCEVKQ